MVTRLGPATTPSTILWEREFRTRIDAPLALLSKARPFAVRSIIGVRRIMVTREPLGITTG